MNENSYKGVDFKKHNETVIKNGSLIIIPPAFARIIIDSGEWEKWKNRVAISIYLKIYNSNQHGKFRMARRAP